MVQLADQFGYLHSLLQPAWIQYRMPIMHRICIIIRSRPLPPPLPNASLLLLSSPLPLHLQQSLQGWFATGQLQVLLLLFFLDLDEDLQSTLSCPCYPSNDTFCKDHQRQAPFRVEHSSLISRARTENSKSQRHLCPHQYCHWSHWLSSSKSQEHFLQLLCLGNLTPL